MLTLTGASVAPATLSAGGAVKASFEGAAGLMLKPPETSPPRPSALSAAVTV